MEEKLSHFDEKGSAQMVDVTDKAVTKRRAIAQAIVKMNPKTLKLIMDKGISKGDVFGVATVAGVMGAKQTPTLIPMCHPLNITSVNIEFKIDVNLSTIQIDAIVGVTGQTGVEMEALTAVSVAALTIYDMCKSVDKEIVITDIMLIEKSGGKSGLFKRN
ncbi:MAG: cyclic pyranopterin monophosphate synthase MoaC [Nitrospirae bacterium]|nr:cyclic pyranopterin monophosphate synthase MoaC [Nitrospirota bacterium]